MPALKFNESGSYKTKNTFIYQSNCTVIGTSPLPMLIFVFSKGTEYKPVKLETNLLHIK